MHAEDKIIMPKEYLKPKSIKEAVELLKKHGNQARVLAGGTDLFPDRTGLREIIIDISEAGLDYINVTKNGLSIGACTTFTSLIEKLEGGPFKVIADAVQDLGTPQVRNIATIGGNLCNASPAGDSAPLLYVLEAKLKVTRSKGSRAVAIDDFMIDEGKTVLKPDEILEEIQVPAIRDGGMYISFDKVKRVRGKDLAIVNGAVAVVLDSNRKCQKARICLGAVAPTPIRARAAEQLLEGKQLSEELIEKVAEEAADATKPIDDVRASAAYRKLRTHVLVKRALLAAMKSLGL